MSLQHYWRIFNKKGKCIEACYRSNQNFCKVKNKDLIIKACPNKVFKVYKIKQFPDMSNYLEYLYWTRQSGLDKLVKEVKTL